MAERVHMVEGLAEQVGSFDTKMEEIVVEYDAFGLFVVD